ncbi:hypothetical protein BB560_005244 [Smittium megazygosporum]|uniref:Uncharacterized protein n=1 Tax=Smittium megazygosporum TaxID=133381 RepID=A0A2T9Z6Z9_9FUNG|nr:hypothetical protein BB560_005244 [Smittium megazygosporum]
MKGYGYLVAFFIAVASVKGAVVKDKLEAREVQPVDMNVNKPMMYAKRQSNDFNVQETKKLLSSDKWKNAVKDKDDAVRKQAEDHALNQAQKLDQQNKGVDAATAQQHAKDRVQKIKDKI